ncbi:hypothetical protein BH11PSE11_BH11PSE11_21150 [soil metagenome]
MQKSNGNHDDTHSKAATSHNPQVSQALADVGEAAQQTAKASGEVLSSIKSSLTDLAQPIVSKIDLNAAKDAVAEKLAASKKVAIETAQQAKQKLDQGVVATTDLVKERPLQSVALVAGVGILIGMLIARRASR